MGMTYAYLSRYSALRKLKHLGPYGMFFRLLEEWSGGGKLSPHEVVDKVNKLFHSYQTKRHKQTVATPAYDAESYSPDDRRFDLRPFLYPPVFQSWSFAKIDNRVEDASLSNSPISLLGLYSY
jgi:NAD+ synthase (glutamine-hydrolysing)